MIAATQNSEKATRDAPLKGTALLQVENLNVRFHGRSIPSLENVDLEVFYQQPAAIVGPSGSGKSVFLSAITGLLEGADVRFQRIRLQFRQEVREWQSVPYDLYRQEARALWAQHTAYLFQDAINHLHPFRSVMEQLLEAAGDGGEEAVRRICGETEGVGLFPLIDPDEDVALKKLAQRNAGSLSGGMCQRVFIARALLKKPTLLIADEPFTDIDRTSQRGIQDLIAHHFIQGSGEGTLLLATHDHNFLRRHEVERKGVIYAVDPEARTIRPLEGLEVPSPAHQPKRPPGVSQVFARVQAPASFTYPGERRPAVNSTLDLEFRRGEVLGVVGESGSGKSTLAKLLARLEGDNFKVVFPDLKYRGRNGLYRFLQVAFQDSAGTLNRREPVGKILKSILKTRGFEVERVDLDTILEVVGLDTQHGNSALVTKTPHQLSMGMQRRFSLLKALLSICEPGVSSQAKLVILDEVTRGLDSRNRQAIIDLIFERNLGDLTLPKDLGLVVISHDLDFVSQIADRILVMFRGWVVEVTESRDGNWRFLHPYSKQLFSSENPELKPKRQIKRKQTDLCPFFAYCPLAFNGVAGTDGGRCVAPPWQMNESSSNRYLCAVENTENKDHDDT